MTSNKFGFRKSLMPALRNTGLAAIACVLCSTSLLAQGVPKKWESQKYQPPFSLGTPDNLSQGGTRSGADQDLGPRLLPLVPQDHNFGVTTEAYPSFLVYVPEFTNQPNVDTLEFLLLDEEGAEVYRARFNVQLNNQVLRIDLPKFAGLSPLEEGKNYLWLLEGFTQDFSLSETLFAHGWVRRVPRSEKLVESLNANEDVVAQANVYIREQIWYDAIALLEEGFAEGTASSAVIEQWDALLQSAGVTDVAIQSDN
ncbi:MAG: DUF928 domain-containing protein [Limnothrix sp. RL_2_0]|nr:DUF928 domain-containing protein [Limnothrix sp. RL_2_0]